MKHQDHHAATAQIGVATGRRCSGPVKLKTRATFEIQISTRSASLAVNGFLNGKARGVFDALLVGMPPETRTAESVRSLFAMSRRRILVATVILVASLRESGVLQVFPRLLERRGLYRHSSHSPILGGVGLERSCICISTLELRTRMRNMELLPHSTAFILCMEEFRFALPRSVRRVGGLFNSVPQKLRPTSSWRSTETNLR